MNQLVLRLLPLCLLCALAAAAQTPVGREIVVNQTRAGLQWSPDAGVAADGSFVVVWEDEDEGRVWARRYGANGKPRGGEIRVSRLGDRRQRAPAVAVRPDGSFVVVWNRVPASGNPEVYASRFDTQGRPVGQPRLVAFAARASDRDPASVVILPDGGFFVAWALDDGGVVHGNPSRDVHGRRFTRDGVLVGGRVTLNGDSFGDQSDPECAAERGEGLVCVWTSDLGEGSFGEIMVRRFDFDGQPRGNDRQVNEEETAFAMQLNPSLAVRDDGTVLVVWEDFVADPGPGESDAWGVLGRVLEPEDLFLRPSFRLHTAIAGIQSSPQAAATDEGFVVVWAGREVLLRTLRADGVFTSAERVINLKRDGFQGQPAVAYGMGGGAVAWVSGPTLQVADIAARRLR